MFNNFIKVAIRNILKHKAFSIINITGLAIGIATCLIISLYVQSELGYDRFHRDADRVYRVAMKFHVGSNQFDVAQGPAALGEALVKEYPEVEAAARLYNRESICVRRDNERFQEERFLWADSNIFELFTIELISGDEQTVLSRANSVVITPATAAKYFGSEDPVGKTLLVEDSALYTVAGVAEEMPPSSHFHFDFLASFSSLEESRDPEWNNLISAYNYIRMSDVDASVRFEARLEDFSRKYLGAVVEQTSGITFDEFLQAGNYLGFFLQPLPDIHLKSNLANELEVNGSITTVLIFSAIALLILVVACINFVNLTTAKATARANEVGVRKAVGSSRRQIIWQFLSESVFLSGVAVVLAVLIVCNFIPLFNDLLGTNLTVSFLTDWYFLPAMVALILIVGITAGIYPAFVLSAFNPVSVLKGKYESSFRGRFFRNTLVVFQFAASIILFVGTAVTHGQLRYVRDKELGYQKENLLVIANASALASAQDAFKAELLQTTGVVNASYSGGLPYMRLRARVYQKDGAPAEEYHTLLDISGDDDFTDTYKLGLVEGRFLDPNRPTDSTALVLNETAVRVLGFDSPVGMRLHAVTGDTLPPFTVIGVVKDFHIESFHDEIRPVVLSLIAERPAPYLSVRLRPDSPRELVGRLETVWNRFVPNQPLEHVFYDEYLAEDYEGERQLNRVLSTFSVLAILIACLGLYGLASYTAARRSKEIGIRKVFGASAGRVALLLSREFTKWVLVANLLAWPVAYYVMRKWLDGFAYRIDLNLMTFVLAGFAALLITALTVSYQAIRAARANPVDSIQYE
ncbi:MAG: ABC transporter permease [Candidatus Zixiibacteriota bacterium]|nr:MAG: ABC transporter permease [candidate division Zixibacteria bacterium]